MKLVRIIIAYHFLMSYSSVIINHPCNRSIGKKKKKSRPSTSTACVHKIPNCLTFNKTIKLMDQNQTCSIIAYNFLISRNKSLFS